MAPFISAALRTCTRSPMPAVPIRLSRLLRLVEKVVGGVPAAPKRLVSSVTRSVRASRVVTWLVAPVRASCRVLLSVLVSVIAVLATRLNCTAATVVLAVGMA